MTPVTTDSLKPKLDVKNIYDFGESCSIWLKKDILKSFIFKN